MSSDLVIQLGHAQVQLLKGDITAIAVDAIVNAANSDLAGGGGVDGAIHDAGGPEIMRQLREVRAQSGPCPAGQAVVTGAGLLPAKYVFHAVGPRYRGGRNGEPEQLASCYSTSLQLAADRDLKTISFPSISTGIYGYPAEAAAEIALNTVAEWLQQHTTSLRTIKLVQYSDRDHQIYRDTARKLHAALLTAAKSAGSAAQ